MQTTIAKVEHIEHLGHIERIEGIDCAVGESPLWCGREAAWFWVDIPAKTIWRLQPETGVVARWRSAEMVACIAVRDSGGLIAGMESGIFALTLNDDGTVTPQRLATPAPAELLPGMRFNDGRCDRQGRFWSGTMLMNMAAARPDGHLYRYTARHGLSAPVVSNLLVQNGLAWSPDGTTMYLSDSHPARQLVWAFDYDIDEGLPHHQRLFIDMNAYPGRPDGAAVDSDGCYWICGNDEACILRFTPAGKLDRKIAVPMPKPSMCSFGGPDLDTLMVTSIGAGKADGDAWAGAVLLLRPGIKGVAETLFRG